MTTPNYDNIDRWLFDYVEGNLSSEQESSLENYILNHPELEVDLDMWRMSNIKMSDAFVNDINIPQKTERSNSYRLVNVFGVFLILLIGRQVHFDEIIDPSNKDETQVSQNAQNKSIELIKENTILSSNIIVNSENQNAYSSINPSLNSIFNISDLNEPNSSLSSIENAFSKPSNIGDPFDLKQLMIEKLNIDLDLQLRSKNTNEFISDKLELREKEIESQSNVSKSLGIKE